MTLEELLNQYSCDYILINYCGGREAIRRGDEWFKYFDENELSQKPYYEEMDSDYYDLYIAL